MSKGRGFGYSFSRTTNKVHILQRLALPSSAITTLNSSHSRFGFHSSAVFRDVRRFGRKHNVSPNYRLRDDINKIGSLDDVVGLYQEMVRMRPLPNVIDFSQLLVHLVKMKQFPAAISMYKNMYVKSIPVDSYTLSIIINCFCLEGRVDFGFSILGAFFKRGIAPNVTTFSTLLRGLFRENRASGAQELFRKIIYQNLCEMDEVMMGTVIDGLGKIGKTELAVEFFRLLKIGGTKPNKIMYSIIIDCLSKDNMMDKALALLGEMIEKGIAPDVITYSCLIRGFCSLGKLNEVNRLWVEMLSFDIAPNVHTYNILIDSFVKHGFINEAMDVFETMVPRSETPDVITYSTVMNALCKHGLVEEAKVLFAQMEANGCLADEITYNIIVRGLLVEEKYDDVVTYLDKMVGRDFVLDSSNGSHVVKLISKKENAPAPLQKMIQRFQNVNTTNVNYEQLLTWI